MPRQLIGISGPGDKKIAEIIRNQKISRTEIYKYVAELFKLMAPRAAAHVVRTQLSGGGFRAQSRDAKGRFRPQAKSPNKQKKHRRTGSLARSIMGRGVMEGGRPAMEIGTLGVTNRAVSAYAWTQEFGTQSENPSSPIPDITPKRARALTVPFGRNLTAAGATRRTIDDFGQGELKAIIFKTPRGKHGNVIGKLLMQAEYDAERAQAIAENRAPDFRALEPMFLLLTRVKIRPGWYLQDGVRDFMPTVTAELVKGLTDRFIGRPT